MPYNLLQTNNPHLFLFKDNIEKIIVETVALVRQTKTSKGDNTNISVLDIGGGRGFGKIFTDTPNLDYYVLDIENHKNVPNVYVGDVTSPELNLNKKFDLVFTKDTFEHILNPWDSTRNILNMLKEGGIFLFMAPFSWRYHASPVDTYRYTHTGARYLFERLGGLEHIVSGYRYYNIGTSGWYSTRTDQTMNNRPFGDCISTIYIAKRDSSVVFSRNSLNFDNEPHTRLRQ